MIYCEFIRNQQNLITKIKLNGHALTAEHGQDLTCAGVSAITFGFLNHLHQDYAQYVNSEVHDNSIKIEFMYNSNIQMELRAVINLFVDQLATIHNHNSKAIQITNSNDKD